MSILLLAECWPYRASSAEWDNSQSRLLAKTCGVTVTQLKQLCSCQYVINKYIPSCKKDGRYDYQLGVELAITIEPIMQQHDLTIFIGKRLLHIMSNHAANFFVEYYTHYMPNSSEFVIAAIPNPLAEYWWKEITNVEKVRTFMKRMFTEYGQ